MSGPVEGFIPRDIEYKMKRNHNTYHIQPKGETMHNSHEECPCDPEVVFAGKYTFMIHSQMESEFTLDVAKRLIEP